MKQANGSVIYGGKQRSAFIQAKTKKRMLEMINSKCVSESMNSFNNYWSFHWNDGMKEAGGDEEGLWVGPDMNYRTPYKKFEKIL